MNNDGKTGCGCLLFILIVCMIVVGLFIHPISLRFVASQFVYGDKIFASDAIVVPWTPEDKQGELYEAAFNEFKAGNGKTIWFEEEKVYGIPLSELISKMAQAKGVKGNVLKKLGTSGEGLKNALKTKDVLASSGAKKIILVVPEYASRYYHILYDSPADEKQPVVLIKPVQVSYFKKDTWWKDKTSRSLIIESFTSICSFYLERFKYGDSKKN